MRTVQPFSIMMGPHSAMGSAKEAGTPSIEIICRVNNFKGLCSLSPLTHNPAAKIGRYLVSHQGTTSVNLLPMLQTDSSCDDKPSPLPFIQSRSAKMGDVDALQHETRVQRRFSPHQARGAGSIFCPQDITYCS